MIKNILIAVAAIAVVVIALNLFNNGNVNGAFGIILASLALPTYFYFKNKGNKKDEKS